MQIVKTVFIVEPVSSFQSVFTPIPFISFLQSLLHRVIFSLYCLLNSGRVTDDQASGEEDSHTKKKKKKNAIKLRTLVTARFICERVNARWAPEAASALRLAISANKSHRLLKEFPPKALNPPAAQSKEAEEGLGASDVFHVLYFSLSLSLSLPFALFVSSTSLSFPGYPGSRANPQHKWIKGELRGPLQSEASPNLSTDERWGGATYALIHAHAHTSRHAHAHACRCARAVL